MRQFVQQLCSETAVVRFAALEAAVSVLTVDEVTVKQLYFQNPYFGCHLVALLAGRSSHGAQRIESRSAGAQRLPRPQH
jgi:hypothetical protein